MFSLFVTSKLWRLSSLLCSLVPLTDTVCALLQFASALVSVNNTKHSASLCKSFYSLSNSTDSQICSGSPNSWFSRCFLEPFFMHIQYLFFNLKILSFFVCEQNSVSYFYFLCTVNIILLELLGLSFLSCSLL